MTAPRLASEPKRGQGGARSAARLAAVQANYQLAMVDTPVETVIEEFGVRGTEAADAADNAGALPAPDGAFFCDLVRGVAAHRDAIDASIVTVIDPAWPIARLDRVLLAVLRTGVCELMRRVDVPVRSIINEYVEVARAFFAGPEPELVNAVLDALARRLRGAEIAVGRSRD